MDGAAVPDTLTAQALVAQWIEHAPPKRGMQVRFLPGARARPPATSRLYVGSLVCGAPVPRSSRVSVAAAPCYRPRVLVSESTRRSRPARPDGSEPRDLRRLAPGPCAASCARYTWLAGGRRRCRALGDPRHLGPTRPGFDPYGWLMWGHMTMHGGLDTNAAPSWKPLPYLFTAPYALFGSYELWLWMITSVAISLSGVVFAARIAYRLTDAPPERRWAAWAAAVFAGAALLGIQDYFHYILSSQSDPMIVSLCLAAIDLPSRAAAPRARVRARRAGRARAPRGLAVPGPVLAVGLVAPAGHAPGADRRRGGDGAAVVRDPGAHLAHPVRRRGQRDGLRAPADLRPGRRHDPTLSGAALLAAGGGRAARGGAGGLAALVGRSGDPGPGRGRRRLGDRGDRLRPARVAGPGPLHVRGGGCHDRPRRRVRGTRAGRPAAAGRGRPGGERGGGRGGGAARDRPDPAGAFARRGASTRTSTPSGRGRSSWASSRRSSASSAERRGCAGAGSRSPAWSTRRRSPTRWASTSPRSASSTARRSRTATRS